MVSGRSVSLIITPLFHARRLGIERRSHDFCPQHTCRDVAKRTGLTRGLTTPHGKRARCGVARFTDRIIVSIIKGDKNPTAQFFNFSFVPITAPRADEKSPSNRGVRERFRHNPAAYSHGQFARECLARKEFALERAHDRFDRSRNPAQSGFEEQKVRAVASRYSPSANSFSRSK